MSPMPEGESVLSSNFLKPAKTRKDMRDYKKREKKSDRTERKVLQRKILSRLSNELPISLKYFKFVCRPRK